MPEADFHTPGGKRVEGIGVSPDIVANRHWYRDDRFRAVMDFLSRTDRRN